jgi:hypothetical protein
MITDQQVDAKQAQVQRIVQSKAFRTSEVQRNLLQYLADRALAGEGDSIKEYTIGLDVFGKPSSFDPRQESSVRMHVARLRQKLAEYYRTEGTADPVFVDLPKGGFHLQFVDQGAVRDAGLSSAADAAQAGESSTDRSANRRYWMLAGFAVFVAVAIGAVYLFNRPSSGNSEASGVSVPSGLDPDLQELWASFFQSPRPILVCLASESNSAVAAGTANGAFFLGQFLTPNRKREVVLTRSDQISMPEIAMDNVIFVGPTANSRAIESVPLEAAFVLEDKGIRNLHPASGEPALFADHLDDREGEADDTYALVSHVPGLYGNGEMLFLEGRHNSSVMAAVKTFTEPMLARQLIDKLRAEGGRLPRYYQVVLRVRSMDQMPVEIAFVAHRALPGGH